MNFNQKNNILLFCRSGMTTPRHITYVPFWTASAYYWCVVMDWRACGIFLVCLS